MGATRGGDARYCEQWWWSVGVDGGLGDLSASESSLVIGDSGDFDVLLLLLMMIECPREPNMNNRYTYLTGFHCVSWHRRCLDNVVFRVNDLPQSG